MPKLSKRMQKGWEGLDRETSTQFDEAVKLVKERATAKFDETIEIALNLNLDPRKADQNLRGMIQMPHGTGKSVRVAVFARDDAAKAAEKAGAEAVGAEDLAKRMEAGELNFDRCIATPDLMPLVGRLGKVLGPKGLMPNPKLGTVTKDVAEAVKNAKSGQVEYRVEKTGIMQAGIGKASFTEKQLSENIRALTDVVVKARPSSVKGTFINKFSLSSTMGPSVRVNVAEFLEKN